MLTRNVRLPRDVILLYTLLSLIGPLVALQASTKLKVDRIRVKNILTDSDLKSIDTYVSLSLDRMLLSENQNELDKIRKEIIASAKSNSQTVSTRLMYNQRFVSTVQSQYARVFNKAVDLEDLDMAQHVELGLSIVISQLDHSDLCGDLIALLNKKNASIRYWGLKGLSSKTISNHLLTLDATNDLIRNLVAGFRNALNDQTNALVLSKIVAAASLPKFPEALEVIPDCLEKRWEFYNQWKVSDELIDIAMIQTTLEMVGNGSLAENTAMRNVLLYSVGKLFSAGLQRYQMGLRYKDKEDKSLILLDTASQHKLQSLLIESERAFRKACSRIDRTISGNSRLVKAIQSQNWTSIEETFDKLIGPDGEVDRVLKFYSGDHKFPYPSIAAPPESVIEQAKIRQYVAENTYKMLEKQ